MLSRIDRREDLGMNSCLYQSRVSHARLAPARHAFEYTVFYCLVDLDELSGLERRSRLFAVNGPAFYSFHEADHMESGPGQLKVDVIRWLGKQQVNLPNNCRIQLLTLPRFMGYVFNPVSFYYCYGGDGSLICAIAEVGNTFGEKKLYLLPKSDRNDETAIARLPKEFYVSPFSDLDVEFEFELPAPDKSLTARVDDFANGEQVLVTSLSGRRRPLTTRDLLALTAVCPAVTAKVILLIHWQAFLLWFKGFRWFAKADRPEGQTDVLNPHPSLARTKT